MTFRFSSPSPSSSGKLNSLMRAENEGFSLTELLVVIFLILIMLGIGGLSITKNSNASGMNVALSTVESLVFEARDLAMKSGFKTRLVINDNSGDDGYRKELVIAQVDDMGGFSATSRLISLPDGIFIDTRSNGKVITGLSLGAFVSNTQVSYGNGNFPTNVSVEFNPQGICQDESLIDDDPSNDPDGVAGVTIPLFNFPEANNIPTGANAQDAAVIVWRNGSTRRVTDVSLITP